MGDLAARGYRTLRLDEYWQMVCGSRAATRALLLTFDDGYAHVDRVVTPVLLRHGFTAVMFAAPNHLGGRNTWDRGHRFLRSLEIATPDQLAVMAAGRCWELASHALRHADLRVLPRAQRRAELVESRERLSMLARRPVRELAYPYGVHDAGVRDDARLAGYRMAFTASGRRSPDLQRLPRRPVRGGDRPGLFRLKTSSAGQFLYDARAWL
jgi:peptidoglycan/xylan/chitin deacetylase (PgdA/CDA1 family)